MNIEINFKHIRFCTYIYIILPIITFFTFYLHSFIGVCFTIVAIIALCFALKNNSGISDFKIKFPLKYIVFFVLIAVVWAYLGGQGNLYYQSMDWDMRNAIFRDLIDFSWPVKYTEYNKALVYYISYWLPAAAVTKGLNHILRNAEIAFNIGNIVLWIWTSLGIVLVEFMLTFIAKPRKSLKIMLTPVVLILFSGLDILGELYMIATKGQALQGIHLEWWLDQLQFSSLTTCLFWVFNQSVIPWLIILCVLMEKTTKNYVLLGVCCLASGPIPFLGVAVYMIGNAIHLFVIAIKNKTIKEYFKEIFSLSNILFLLLLPVYLLYYQSNSALEIGVNNSESISFFFLTLKPISGSILVKYFFFIMLEVGIYLVLLFKPNKKNVFYYLTWVTAIIAPFFTIGTSSDFVMRFSIPTVMVTASMFLNYMCEERDKTRRDKYITIALWIFFVIGSFTPVTEFVRGYDVMLYNGKIANVCDNVKTLNQELNGMDKNFVTFDYDELFFYKYLAR